MMTIREVNSIAEIEARIEQERIEGLYYIPEQIYHNCPGISQSLIKTYMDAPEKAKWRSKFKSTAAMNDGSLFDCLVTEPEKFNERYAVMPDDDFVNDKGVKTTKGAKVWKDFVSENEGKSCFVENELNEIKKRAEKFKSHKTWKELTKQGHYQLVAFAHVDGILCRGRVDFISQEKIVDVKHSAYGSLRKFRSACWQRRYDIQAAMYLNLFSRFLPDVNRFVFAVAESNFPNLAAFYEIKEHDVMIAMNEINEVLPKIKYSMDNDYWPGYPEEIQSIQMRSETEPEFIEDNDDF
jgi:hypothetical protein